VDVINSRLRFICREKRASHITVNWNELKLYQLETWSLRQLAVRYFYKILETNTWMGYCVHWPLCPYVLCLKAGWVLDKSGIWGDSTLKVVSLINYGSYWCIVNLTLYETVYTSSKFLACGQPTLFLYRVHFVTIYS
jgi:hypothetical protein